MLRVSSSPLAVVAGTRVRLRHRPDDTGMVIDRGLQLGDVKVRWDDSDEVTYISAAQLEAVSQLRLVD
jgi:hypothetical protein